MSAQVIDQAVFRVEGFQPRCSGARPPGKLCRSSAASYSLQVVVFLMRRITSGFLSFYRRVPRNLDVLLGVQSVASLVEGGALVIPCFIHLIHARIHTHQPCIFCLIHVGLKSLLCYCLVCLAINKIHRKVTW